MSEGKPKTLKYDELFEVFCKEQEHLEESQKKLVQVEKKIDEMSVK